MKFYLHVALFSRDFNCKGGTNTGTFTFSREAYFPADTLNFFGVNDEKTPCKLNI